MDEDKEDAIHFINVLSVHINLFNDLIKRGLLNVLIHKMK